MNADLYISSHSFDSIKNVNKENWLNKNWQETQNLFTDYVCLYIYIINMFVWVCVCIYLNIYKYILDNTYYKILHFTAARVVREFSWTIFCLYNPLKHWVRNFFSFYKFSINSFYILCGLLTGPSYSVHESQKASLIVCYIITFLGHKTKTWFSSFG